MSSSRVVAAIITVSVCLILGHSDARAQSCSVASSARGPVSCSISTSMNISIRVPSLVGVTLTTPTLASETANGVIHAGVRVKTNRSYALQIARAPIDLTRPDVLSPSEPISVLWSAGAAAAPLGDTPMQLDGYAEPTADREPVEVSFARPGASAVPALEPIRLILTVVAP
jgi:hypothetical protein